MRAHHEGGQVIIEISDDGRGIDLDGVKAKAVARGLLTASQAVELSDSDACQLVFAPGFSMAEQVTPMSGRGVGMDVVKTNIEKIGGTVELRSGLGNGTTICVKIPLTLAILSALVVRCDGQRYAIPQLDVVELVWLDGSRAGTIEWLHDVPVYRLRGRLLPLLSLREQLGLSPDADLTTPTIVVLAADDRTFGLVVDSVVTTEEIVVKPLGHLLQSVTTYSGATIMGDGSVALILDAAQLAQRAGLAVGTGRTTAPEPVVETATTELRSVLVVACGDDARVALALDSVARLEEMPRAAVEFSDGQPVIQYRGNILPLVELGPLLGRGGSTGEGELLTVVVHHAGGRDVGLVVDRIIDIVEVAVAPDDLAHGCTLVVRDRVTDLIPVTGLLAAAVGWSAEREEVLAR
jgi:two-component system, chemotaxis family, sensor kinase CheA